MNLFVLQTALELGAFVFVFYRIGPEFQDFEVSAHLPRLASLAIKFRISRCQPTCLDLLGLAQTCLASPEFQDFECQPSCHGLPELA